MTTGGTYFYRATAECSACGRVIDVGPFGSITEAFETKPLSDWIAPAKNLDWAIADGFGSRFTICDRCLARPMRDVLADIKERATK